MDRSERGMNLVAKSYHQSSERNMPNCGSNHQPPAHKSCTLPTEIHTLGSIDFRHQSKPEGQRRVQK